MRIKLTDDMKRMISMDEIPVMKNFLGTFKEQKDFKWEASTAVNLAAGRSIDILKVEQEIAKNPRLLWNYYGSDANPTYQFDVWLTIYAFDTYYGFYKVGCYVSDIWSLNSENAEEIKSHLYVLHYEEKK